ncbi:transporter substrate-binding domain-containing protein [Comamonadaceae bacterium G21597-S1]|nr:transporter substrate-binding domain-containing protein [Comamonadaceae bacterium G21597-S1]
MRKILASLILGAVALAAPQWASAQKSTLRQVLDRGTLIAGVGIDQAPFGYVDEKGQPIGFDVDLARLMAEQLGVKLELKQMTSTNRIPFLLTNKVDVQVNLFGATPERARQIAFSSPYTGLTIGVYGPKEVKVTSVKDLGDRPVAVGRGTTMDLTLSGMAPKANIVRFDDEATAQTAVLTGQTEMWAAVNTQIIAANNKNPNKKLELKFMMRVAPASIGVRQGDADWLRWMDTFVYYNKINGKLQELHRKWLDEDLQKDLPTF